MQFRQVFGIGPKMHVSYGNYRKKGKWTYARMMLRGRGKIQRNWEDNFDVRKYGHGRYKQY